MFFATLAGWPRRCLSLSAQKRCGYSFGVINEQAAVLARDGGMTVAMDRRPAIEILAWGWRKV